MNEVIKWYQITEIVPYRNFNFQYHDGDTIAKTPSLNSSIYGCLFGYFYIKPLQIFN